MRRGNWLLLLPMKNAARETTNAESDRMSAEETINIISVCSKAWSHWNYNEKKLKLKFWTFSPETYLLENIIYNLLYKWQVTLFITIFLITLFEKTFSPETYLLENIIYNLLYKWQVTLFISIFLIRLFEKTCQTLDNHILGMNKDIKKRISLLYNI